MPSPYKSNGRVDANTRLIRSVSLPTSPGRFLGVSGSQGALGEPDYCSDYVKYLFTQKIKLRGEACSHTLQSWPQPSSQLRKLWNDVTRHANRVWNDWALLGFAGRQDCGPYMAAKNATLGSSDTKGAEQADDAARLREGRRIARMRKSYAKFCKRLDFETRLARRSRFGSVYSLTDDLHQMAVRVTARRERARPSRANAN